nr:hypothetical protein CFP56_69151 [Quercus suber]
MFNSGIHEDEAVANGCEDDSSLLASDSEMETETLPDQDRDHHGNTNFEEEREGDAESVFADSPADGYFTIRDHPQHTFIQRSNVQTEADRKAREVAQSQAENDARGTRLLRATSDGPTEPSTYQNPAPANAQVLDAGPAPPDYAAATAHRYAIPELRQQSGDSTTIVAHAPARSRRSEHEFSLPRNASSAGANALYWPFGGRNPFRAFHSNDRYPQCPLARQPSQRGTEARLPTSSNTLLYRDEAHLPQSMSDWSNRVPDEETGLLRERKKRRRFTFFGCRIKVMVVLLVIAVIAILGRDSKEWTHIGVPENEKSPSGPALPIAPPVPSESPSLPTPDIPSSRTCPYSSSGSSVAFDFPSPASFSFGEFLQAPELFSGGIHGKILVTTAKASQAASLRVRVTYALTPSWRVSTLHYDLAATSLNLHLPEFHKEPQAGDRRPCLYLDVVIEVKESTALGGWNIATTNLDLVMDEALFNHGDPSLNLNITEASAITTERGNIRGAWSSRNTKIETASGSITGAFAWMDLLSVSTMSGSIDIAVKPQAADPAHIVPAEYIATSHSGSIKTEIPIAFSDTNLPLREYRTQAQTSSGRISGTYIHGTTTSFSTNSGAIDVDIVPIDTRLVDDRFLVDDVKKPLTTTLRTNTRSGTTALHLYPPRTPRSLQILPDDNETIRQPLIDTLKSQHTSRSGRISLTYPDEWTGEIEGESYSGSIAVEGKEVRNPEWMWFLKRYFSRKGSDDDVYGGVHDYGARALIGFFGLGATIIMMKWAFQSTKILVSTRRRKLEEGSGRLPAHCRIPSRIRCIWSGDYTSK